MGREFSLVREEARRAFTELRGARMSPARGAAAVALGLFVGCQPIFGCHLPVIVVACLWLRLDALVAYVAANVSNPFLAPAIVTAEVQLGAWMRTGTWAAIDGRLEPRAAMTHFAKDLALGAPAFGAGLAIAGGVVTFAALTLRRALAPEGAPPAPYRLPDDAPPWVKAVERVAARYSSPDGGARERSRFHYVRTKLLADPIAQMVAGIEGEGEGALGEVLDVGTGNGQLAILLVELGRATSARGVDWDGEKVAAGQRAVASGAPVAVELERGDAREATFPAADTVLLIDLLHYFTMDEQDAILARAAAAVRPGGRILVREADTERGLRSGITWLEERVFTALRWNRGERVNFRSARSIEQRLEAAGLACSTRPAWGRTPFANVLVIGRRSPR